MRSKKLDETDLRILRVMQSDGALTVAEIADRVGISQSPCSRRIAQMTEDGVILGKSVLLDQRKLGFDTVVYVRIKLKDHARDTLKNFKDALKTIPEIQTAVLMLGEFDFNLQIVVRDTDHYKSLLQDKLATLAGIRELQSSVVLETIKNTSALPL